MTESVFRHRSGAGTLLLRRNTEGRWSLTFDTWEICSYHTPEKAAHFVAQGKTGDSRIDGMKDRPSTLMEWKG